MPPDDEMYISFTFVPDLGEFPICNPKLYRFPGRIDVKLLEDLRENHEYRIDSVRDDRIYFGVFVYDLKENVVFYHNNRILAGKCSETIQSYTVNLF